MMFYSRWSIEAGPRSPIRHDEGFRFIRRTWNTFIDEVLFHLLFDVLSEVVSLHLWTGCFLNHFLSFLRSFTLLVIPISLSLLEKWIKVAHNRVESSISLDCHFKTWSRDILNLDACYLQLYLRHVGRFLCVFSNSDVISTHFGLLMREMSLKVYLIVSQLFITLHQHFPILLLRKGNRLLPCLVWLSAVLSYNIFKILHQVFLDQAIFFGA
jgi:hypothetical protein